jgi:glutamyl-tRNA reductase
MYTLSITYKNAPLDIRGRLAFSREEQLDFCKKALEFKEIDGCVVVSTCNRMEIYVSGTDNCLDVTEKLLLQEKGGIASAYKKYFCRYHGKKATEHLFYVVAGIDSMVVGEDEILGQVRDAYQLSLEEKLTDYHLNTIFQGAFTCAKKIKTQTKLSKTSVSVGTLAASEVFRFRSDSKNSEEKKVLLIGMTGKMGGIVLKNLLSKSGMKIWGTVREHHGSHSLKGKENEASAISYSSRYDYIDEADVVISVTASPHYTITAEEAVRAIHTEKERLWIDLAVPRDIDPKVQEIQGIKLMDIDYFETLAKQNSELKLHEVSVAEDMISECLDEVIKELYFHAFLPRMEQFRGYITGNRPEQILFQLRDEATHEELQSFLGLIERVLDVEGN